jgi:hypothetical protein
MSSPHGATWRSGYATVCKTVYSGSIPDVASTLEMGRGMARRTAAATRPHGVLATAVQCSMLWAMARRMLSSPSDNLPRL